MVEEEVEEGGDQYLIEEEVSDGNVDEGDEMILENKYKGDINYEERWCWRRNHMLGMTKITRGVRGVVMKGVFLSHRGRRRRTK